MPVDTEKVKSLDYEKRLNDSYLNFSKFERTLPKNEKVLLKRFKSVYTLWVERVKSADIQRTPFKVFDTAATYSDSVNSFIEYLQRTDISERDRNAYFDNFDNLSNLFLENLPLINLTTNSAEILASAEQNLDKIKLNAKDADKLFEDIQKVLEETLSYKARNETISEQLATKVLVGDFNDRAVSERQTANRWTILTLCLGVSTIIVIVIFTVWQFYSIANQEVNIHLTISKILIASALGLVTKWTSKRASRHLAEESKYHRLAVNLSTMKEFIATLPVEERNSVISIVALKIFTEGTGNDTPTDFESNSLADLLKGVQTAITKQS